MYRISPVIFMLCVKSYLVVWQEQSFIIAITPRSMIVKIQLTAISRIEMRITKKILKERGIKYGAKSLLNLSSLKAIIVKTQNGDRLMLIKYVTKY